MKRFSFCLNLDTLTKNVIHYFNRSDVSTPTSYQFCFNLIDNKTLLIQRYAENNVICKLVETTNNINCDFYVYVIDYADYKKLNLAISKVLAYWKNNCLLTERKDTNEEVEKSI